MQLLWYLSRIKIGLLLTVNLVVGFNLEQRLPIVKYGHPHSHFGYSVATHSIGLAPNQTNW